MWVVSQRLDKLQWTCPIIISVEKRLYFAANNFKLFGLSQKICLAAAKWISSQHSTARFVLLFVNLLFHGIGAL